MSLVDVHSHRTQLVLTALGATFATASLLSLYNAHERRKRRLELSEDIRKRLVSSASRPSDLPGSKSSKFPPPPDAGVEADIALLEKGKQREALRDVSGYDEELVREQLARNYAFLGEESMKKVRNGKVVIVGCGGVGSWAAVMLARSGVSSIRLVDFDYVALSSLNRHATATLADVGTPKVHCVANALRQIARFVDVDARVELWRDDEDGADLLDGVDWVIDAIDNIGTKVDLLKYCVQHNIKVFSSMGAGAKTDPTRIQIADLSQTLYDPLARAVRQRLRAAGIPSTDSADAAETGIPVVYSTEVPGDVGLLPLSEDEFAKGKINELSVFEDFRVRILPVLGPLPALFGLHIATYIICYISGKPLERPLPVRHRKKVYDKLSKELLRREERIAGTVIGPSTRRKLPLPSSDIAILFEDISLARSVVPPHVVCARPALLRWDPSKPLSLENCIVAEEEEVDKAMAEVFGVHVEGVEPGNGDPDVVEVDALGRPLATGLTRRIQKPEKVWGHEVAKMVKKRIEEAERFRKWALES
ncbi:hypothetical protein EVG20_g3087 [Dentipellis fragilis]|uniref:THIF-type NAD/FAD binding fold domain-containing protein n=1 Tax=Dentipellis fragilis TaxID=205917 RepID=A0A4Y9Z705_9AGAM|nr:hypothetical protein EVG20_g3087 [Dentipellis fragilis]